ncbi:MAG: hypothetical protein LBH29_01560, partial [Elusimicrobiota bacterium]|nr:hypothetical protein [Elusimicrobiota bacterium]
MKTILNGRGENCNGNAGSRSSKGNICFFAGQNGNFISGAGAGNGGKVSKISAISKKFKTIALIGLLSFLFYGQSESVDVSNWTELLNAFASQSEINVINGITFESNLGTPRSYATMIGNSTTALHS